MELQSFLMHVFIMTSLFFFVRFKCVIKNIYNFRFCTVLCVCSLTCNSCCFTSSVNGIRSVCTSSLSHQKLLSVFTGPVRMEKRYAQIAFSRMWVIFVFVYERQAVYRLSFSGTSRFALFVTVCGLTAAVWKGLYFLAFDRINIEKYINIRMLGVDASLNANYSLFWRLHEEISLFSIKQMSNTKAVNTKSSFILCLWKTEVLANLFHVQLPLDIYFILCNQQFMQEKMCVVLDLRANYILVSFSDYHPDKR